MGVGLNVVRFFGKAMRIHHLLEEQRALRLSEHEEEDDGEQAVALARSIVESMNVIKFVGKLRYAGAKATECIFSASRSTSLSY